jgi:hypothetical protein
VDVTVLRCKFSAESRTVSYLLDLQANVEVREKTDRPWQPSGERCRSYSRIVSENWICSVAVVHARQCTNRKRVNLRL